MKLKILMIILLLMPLIVVLVKSLILLADFLKPVKYNPNFLYDRTPGGDVDVEATKEKRTIIMEQFKTFSFIAFVYALVANSVVGLFSVASSVTSYKLKLASKRKFFKGD